MITMSKCLLHYSSTDKILFHYTKRTLKATLRLFQFSDARFIDFHTDYIAIAFLHKFIPS